MVVDNKERFLNKSRSLIVKFLQDILMRELYFESLPRFPTPVITPTYSCFGVMNSKSIKAKR